MLTAVDLGIFSPGLFGVAAGLLLHVFRVEPALEMAAAELALGVLLVTGALSRLLDLDLVPGKLWYLGAYGSAGGQICPRRAAYRRRGSTDVSFYSKGFAGRQTAGQKVRLGGA
jgi:hypothetical protein